MRKFSWLGVAAAALLTWAPTASSLGQNPPAQAAQKPTTGKVGEKIPGFTAKVIRGEKTEDFDSVKTGKTTVYFLVGVTCPATAPYAERLSSLESAYMPKNVDFVYIYVNVPETLAEKTKFHKDKKFKGGFLNDEQSVITKKIAATKTGEVLIVDKEGTVVYRGGIDDNLTDPSKVKSKYVSQALDEMLAGKPVSLTTGKNFG